MKIYLILFILPVISLGQIYQVTNNKFEHVGNINRSKGAVPNIVLDMSIGLVDTMFVLRFEDATFQSPIFSSSQPLRETIYFKGSNNTISQLYDLLNNVFIDKHYEDKDFETTLILGTRTIVIKRDFYSEKTRVQLIADGRMFFIKNQKELDQLFGM